MKINSSKCFGLFLITIISFVSLFSIFLQPTLATSGNKEHSTDPIIAKIILPTHPENVAVNPNTTMIYATTPGSIMVINGNSNTVVKKIPIAGFSTSNIAINPKTNIVYLGNSISSPNHQLLNMLYVINGSDIRSVPQPDQISKIFIDQKNNTLYLNYNNIETNLVNGENPEHIIKKIKGFGSSTYLSDFNSNTRTILSCYLCNERNNISIIDTSENKIVANISVAESPRAIGVNTNTNIIYVVNHDGTRLSLINGIKNALIETLLIGNRSSGYVVDGPPLAIDTNSNLLYILYNDHLSVIDGYTNRIASTLMLKEPEQIAVNSKTSLVYVTEKNSNEITVINGSRKVLMHQFIKPNILNIPGIKVSYSPYKIAINPITNRIFVTDSVLNVIKIIDGKTDKVVNTLKVGNHPYGIAVNSITNTLYVTDPMSKSLFAIDLDDNSIKHITVGNFPGYVIVDEANNMIYVSDTQNECISTCSTGNKNSSSIYVVNGNTNTVEDRIDTYLVSGTLALVGDTIYTMSGVPAKEPLVIRGLVRYGDQSYKITSNITINDIPTESIPKPTIAVNPTTGLLYALPGGYGNMSVVDTYTKTVLNKTATSYAPQLAANPNTDVVYVTDWESGTLLVINGISNKLISRIPVGDLPQNIAVNPNTNTIYVTRFGSDTITVIDGKNNTALAGIAFHIYPLTSGIINCNKQIFTNNYSKYDIGTPITCTAFPNKGYEFSSWSADLGLKPPVIISSLFDFISYLWFGSTVSNSNNISNLNNIPQTTFVVSKYGSLNANFIASNPISIPPEFWTPLYAIIPGFFIPSAIAWLNGYRQRRHLREYLRKVGKSDKSQIEKDITKLYTEGKINESHYKMLQEKISEYYKDIDRS